MMETLTQLALPASVASSPNVRVVLLAPEASEETQTELAQWLGKGDMVGGYGFNAIQLGDRATFTTPLEELRPDVALLWVGAHQSKQLMFIHSFLGINPDVALVILTARGNDDFAMECVRQGAQDVLALDQLSLRDCHIRIVQSALRGVIRSQLRCLRDLAREQTQEQFDFLSRVNHELRTPLNGINGAAAYLMGLPLEKEIKEHIEIINECGRDLTVAVGTILELSGTDEESIDSQKLPVSLCKMLDALNAPLVRRAEERKINFALAIPATLPKVIRVNTRAVSLIFTAFCNSAIKCAISESHVLVSVGVYFEQSSGRYFLRATICDSGSGDEALLRNSLLEVFAPGEAQMRARSSGKGLGLASAGRLLRTVGGNLSVADTDRSNVEEYSVSLPVEMVSDDTPTMGFYPAKHIDAAGEAKTKLKILLVDDTEINRRVASRLLAKSGHCVELATDGADAVRLACEAQYDVVLMDIQMPVMGGYEATRLIREHDKRMSRHTPIIAVTAHASMDDRAKCLNAGMDDWLPKPIDYDLLKSILELRAAKES